MEIFSLEFWLFTGAVFALYWLMPKRISKYIMVFAGVLVCGAFGLEVLTVAFGCAIFTYFWGIGISAVDDGKKKILLWLGISALVTVIVVSRLELIPSIGVSFYVFRYISYLVDVKKTSNAERNIAEYMFFATFFPVFVAGPVVRYSQLEKQINRARFSYDSACRSLYQIAFGIFQKAYMADKLSYYVDRIYDGYSHYNGITIAVGAALYSFQIYFDFAGYSNIVIGIAGLFGVRIDNNFEQPYFSLSIKEFWRRWHISLSSWLKDYVYIPLGGKNRKYVNILNTFFISGLWHGKGMGFIVWGGLHAVYQVIGDVFGSVKEALLKNIKKYFGKNVEKAFEMVFTFGLVTFAWFFFRVSDMSHASVMLGYAMRNVIRGDYGLSIVEICGMCPGIIVIGIIDYLYYSQVDLYEWIKRQRVVIKCCINTCMIVFLAILFVMKVGGDYTNFIYAKF